MGSVWAAEHLILNSQVAVKIIDSAIAQNQEALGRFLREAQAAAQLRSPHVVQTLDYGVEDSVPFIAMELLEGESLAQRLDRMKRLSLDATAKILTEVGRAISKAHETGIVHRDLKPDNIYLVKNDDDEIAKVLDFGIAKATNAALGNSSQTRTGAILGTPYYMSPEQAEGNRSIDHRTDLWSLAVIAFECVTGRKPFQSEALGDLILQICVKPIKKPSAFEPVPAAFDDWFAKATQRDPAQRFQSARELTTSLRAAAGLHAGGADMAKVPFGTRNISQRPPTTQPLAESSSGRPLNATTGGVGGVAHTSTRTTTKQQMSTPVIVSATLGALAFAGVVGFFALRSFGQAPSGSAASSSAPVETAPPGRATAEAPAVEPPKPPEPRASAEVPPPAEAAPTPESPTTPEPKTKTAATGAPPQPAVRGRAKAAPVAQPPTPAKPVEKSSSTSKRVDFGF
jgi:serine/threonine-protein kinase